ncbi:hypothetical protein ACKGF3_000097 [Salmonella enterica]|nr:hypothetical protein [Salmonella enterica subsp. enterica]EHI1992557.1 hypothetical protein [Salmonella enterica]EIT8883653.1 hypothetical protein [Salmonella enterica subsp. enterica serovar Tananarive]
MMGANRLPPIAIGQQFGRWTVLCPSEPKTHTDKFGTVRTKRKWKCICSCGTERSVLEHSLRHGLSVSCGCFNKEVSSIKGRTHGLTETAEYVAWQCMRQRVKNPNNRRRKSYSGRGIDICERWDDFTNFLADMGQRPSNNHSIDRVDNNKGYSPENCRWATPKEQMANRRKSLYVDYKGERMVMSELARRCGIPANTLRSRIIEKGWDIERATTQPVRPKRK